MRILFSSFAAMALLTIPAWSQTAPASSSTPATPSPTTASATPATAASPAPAAPVSTASAEPATQSQFKIVIITPGTATPSVVNESTPPLVAASLYPTVSGLIDPNVGFQNMLNRAILTRLSYPPVVIGAPVVSVPVPVVPVQMASPYRFSSGYDVGGY